MTTCSRWKRPGLWPALAWSMSSMRGVLEVGPIVEVHLRYDSAGTSATEMADSSSDAFALTRSCAWSGLLRTPRQGRYFAHFFAARASAPIAASQTQENQ